MLSGAYSWLWLVLLSLLMLPAVLRLLRALALIGLGPAWRLPKLVIMTLKFGSLSLYDRRRRPHYLCKALEEMGGAWIKLGQALALRYDLLPAAYCLELFRLLNKVKPISYQAIRQVIYGELGAYPEGLFQSFEQQPFACASIAQVHRGRLRSGEQVAIKVQRPNVRQEIRADIVIMYLIAWSSDVFGLFGAAHLCEIIDEFARWTAQELDFRVEAQHAEKLRHNQGNDGLEQNARAFGEYSGERVLTTEFVEGILLVDLLKALREGRYSSPGAPPYDPEAIAQHINWNLLNQIYLFGYFHADLHPANIVVLPFNQIGYVDFGITGQLSDELRESFLYYGWNLYRGDAEKAADEFLRWVTPSQTADVGSARADLIGIISRYLESLAQVSRANETVGAQSCELEALAMIRKHQMSVSPSVVLTLKALVTSNEVIWQLSPTYNLRTNQIRFLSRMIKRWACEAISPAEILPEVFEYAHGIRRTVQAVQEAVDKLQQGAADGGSSRRNLWIFFFAVSALLTGGALLVSSTLEAQK